MNDATFIVHQMRAAGIPDANIIGVLNGIVAEGGKFGEVDQTDARGNSAHGIGQWRGARWAALRRLYGPNPTRAQEVAFLISELKGGDPGGAGVLAATSSAAATRAYLQGFMRPGSGLSGDMARAGLTGGSSGGGSIGQVGPIYITVPAGSDAKAFANALRKAIQQANLANRGLS